MTGVTWRKHNYRLGGRRDKAEASEWSPSGGEERSGARWNATEDPIIIVMGLVDCSPENNIIECRREGIIIIEDTDILIATFCFIETCLIVNVY